MAVQKSRVVNFREYAGFSQKFLLYIGEKVQQYGFNKLIPFDCNEIVVSNWVYQKCLYGCRRYNTNWCCPPVTPEPGRAKEIIQEYSLALLLVGEQSCSAFYRDNEAKRLKQIRHWKGALSLERLLFLEGYYKVFSIIGTNCPLCKQCAYPENCLFPQEKRPSVESYSIDLLGTLKKIGIPSQIANSKIAPFKSYSIVFVH